MLSKRLISGMWLLILLTVAMVAGGKDARAQTQNQLDLSGNWELIEVDGTKKSHNPKRFPRLTLVISQAGPEIKITQTRVKPGSTTVQEFTYYTDGRGETNQGRIELWPRDVPRFKSLTGWDKGKLLTKHEEQLSLGTSYSSKGSGEYSSTNTRSTRKDEWTRSSDGNTLVLRTSYVEMDFGSIVGRHTPPGSIQGNAGNDRNHAAPPANFFRSKLIFRRIP